MATRQGSLTRTSERQATTRARKALATYPTAQEAAEVEVNTVAQTTVSDPAARTCPAKARSSIGKRSRKRPTETDRSLSTRQVRSVAQTYSATDTQVRDTRSTTLYAHTSLAQDIRAAHQLTSLSGRVAPLMDIVLDFLNTTEISSLTRRYEE